MGIFGGRFVGNVRINQAVKFIVFFAHAVRPMPRVVGCNLIIKIKVNVLFFVTCVYGFNSVLNGATVFGNGNSKLYAKAFVFAYNSLIAKSNVALVRVKGQVEKVSRSRIELTRSAVFNVNVPFAVFNATPNVI